MELLRKTVHITPEDFAESKEKIKFYVYDGFGFSGAKKDVCYLERKTFLDAILAAYDVVEFVPTYIVHSEKELEEQYQKFLADKQEGAILRILGIGYEHGKTKNLLKYKPVDDAEYRVISIQEGSGKFAGRAATITCQRIDGEKFKDGTDTFNTTFKGTKEEAFQCLKEAKKYIGKVVTIYYNGLTGFGKPNYAQFDINNYDKGH